MTVVGEAYIKIKAEDDVTPALAGTGQKIEDEVGGHAEKASTRLKAAFSSIGKSLSSAMGPAFAPIGELMDHLEGIGEAAEGMRSKFGKSLLAIGGVATGVGTLLTTLGDKDKIAMGQLQKAVENAGGSWEKYHEETEKAVKAGEHFGNTAVDTQNALNTLITKTGNVEDSYKNLQLATDLAAQKHISLGAASNVVARVMLGNTKTLKQYGITADDIAKITDVGAKKVKMDTLARMENRLATEKSMLADTKDKNKKADLHKAIAEQTIKTKELKDEIKNMTTATEKGDAGTSLLAAKLKGQAAVAADTFTGKMKAAKATVEDFIGQVGQKVGPALQVAGPALMGIGAIVESGIIGKFGKGVKALALWDQESKIVQATTKVWTGVQAAFNLVMAANPIVLITIAIAALIGVVVLAYLKFKPFHDLVNSIAKDVAKFFVSAFGTAERAFRAFVNFFEQMWKTVVDIVKKYWPIALAVLLPMIGIPVLIIRNWGKITGFFRQLWSDVTGWVSRMASSVLNTVSNMTTRAVNYCSNLVTGAVNWLSGLPGKIAHALGTLGSTVSTAISNGLRNAKQWVTNAFSGAGSWLYDEGVSIISGLVSGIRDTVGGALKSTVGKIGGFIKSLKGPKSYDMVMLREEGEAIMIGLTRAIESRMPHLKNTMKNVTGAINVPVGASAVGGAAGAGGVGRVINLFPYASIDFGKEDPAAVVQRLETAIVASRL